MRPDLQTKPKFQKLYNDVLKTTRLTFMIAVPAQFVALQ